MKSPDTHTKEMQNRLRKAHLKATRVRLLALSIFRKTRRPLSAQELIDAVGPRADQATMYRVLHDFKRCGIIRPIDLRHNHAHYEIADADDHHHLVCARCGRIEDVPECGIEDVQKTVLRASRAFSKIVQHSLEFYGICRSCEGKEHTKTTKTLEC